MPPDTNTDPYRTLGLEPGAPMAEVKRAYRRLAKAFHPDSAGEAALPRFLAIHEAYEVIKGGGTPRIATTRPTPPTEPWRADPARARAARQRASAGRNRTGARGTGAGPAGATGTSGAASGGAAGGRGTAAGERPGATGSRPTGSTGSTRQTRSTGGATGGRGTGRSSGRRETRKATLGSTSYDEARDPTDATWSGASWYGPTTGEYWIVNPREYADPRKHGPDYQSRARRPLTDDEAGAAPPPEVDGAFDPDAAGATSATGAAADAPGAPMPGPEPARPRASALGADHAARRWAGAAGPGWESTYAARARAAHAGRELGGDGPPSMSGPFTTTASEWLGGPADDPIRRLGIALVAWPPLGLAAAAAIGEVTGCTAYAAECTGTDSLLPWLAQAGILGLLLLLPPIARLLAGGAVAVVLALVPATAFLIVVGGTGEPQAGFALAFLLGVAWLAGVGWSVWAARRRRTTLGAEGPS